MYKLYCFVCCVHERMRGSPFYMCPWGFTYKGQEGTFTFLPPKAREDKRVFRYIGLKYTIQARYPIPARFTQVQYS